MALTSVNSIGIKDGEIVNADVNASADIAGSKLADDSIAEVKLDISNTASDGQFLQYKDSSDKLTWADASSTPTTTRGDIIYRGASADQRLAKGTDGQFLKIGANDPVWADVAAGAVGGGTNKIFWENEQTIDYNYTVTNNHNAMSAGPITIAATGNGDGSAVVVTVGDGETWTIV